MKKLLKKIQQKKSNVLVIGLGYVGLPLLKMIVKSGFRAFGLDINQNLVRFLKKKNKTIKFFSNYKDVNFNQIDIIIIALPTPLKKKNLPDLSYIEKCRDHIFKYVKKSKLIILESTSYPGTTREFFIKKLKKNIELGRDIFIGYSPEREDPGNKEYNIKTITKIVSGGSDNCKKLTKCFYDHVCNKTIVANSLEIAEMAKLYENIFRSVNIGLSNETNEICNKLGINFNEVLKLANTKPFGFMPFYPGPGVGGHCIPVDPFYLSWLAKRKKINTKFIELAGKINNSQPLKVLSKIKKILNLNKISKKNKILILGIAYKKNVSDLRNSPGLKIFQKLIDEFYNVEFNDDFVVMINYKNKNYKSIKINKNQIKKYKLVILLTDHDYINKNLFIKNSKLIIDTRNFFPSKNKVIYL